MDTKLPKFVLEQKFTVNLENSLYIKPFWTSLLIMKQFCCTELKNLENIFSTHVE